MIALIALLVPALVSGCGSAASAHAKILRMAVPGRLAGSDPALAATDQARLLASLLFSGLVKLGPDLHVIPELAVSIPTISEDGKSYTFTIRHDARFEDGRRCTARDVAYSLARALRPQTGSPTAHQYLGNIVGAPAVEAGRRLSLSGVRIVDRLTVRIRLRRPDAEFLDKLTEPVASVVEKSRIGQYRRGVWGGFSAGTGPWAVAKRDSHGVITLVPRHHSYGGTLQINALVLVPVSSATQAIALYRRGQVDVAEAPPDQYRTLSQRSDIHSSPALDGYYAVTGGSDGIALAATIDRDKLVQDLSSSVTALDSIVPSAMPDYLSSPPAIDTTGSNTGTGVSRVRLTGAFDKDWIARELRQGLARQWPTSPHAALHIRVLHVSASLPDPSIWLRGTLAEGQSRWFTTIVSHAALLTNDPVGRMNAYSRAENWAIAEGYVIPLISSNHVYLMRAAVDGLQVTPLGLMPDNNTWSSVSVA